MEDGAPNAAICWTALSALADGLEGRPTLGCIGCAAAN
jgi:hypothetical protein